MIAGLMEDDNDGQKLLDAARGLAGAFSDLLKAAQLSKDGKAKDVRTKTSYTVF